MLHIQDVTNAPSAAPHAEAPNDSGNSESEDDESGPTEPVGLGAVLIQPIEEMILQTADVSRWHTKSGKKKMYYRQQAACKHATCFFCECTPS